MRAKTVQEVLDEGYGTGFGGSYGAGYSYIGGTRGMISGTRGGFGGANNLGGPNMMYTYEISAVNTNGVEGPKSDPRSATTDPAPNGPGLVEPVLIVSLAVGLILTLRRFNLKVKKPS